MLDDTLYMPRDKFERKMKVEEGIRAFREYRLQIAEEEKEEIIYYPKTDFEWELKEERGFPAFVRYKRQVEIEKQKERDLIGKYNNKYDFKNGGK